MRSSFLGTRHRTLAVAFAVGFSSLVYEVYSAKILFLYFVESTQAVAVTLSAFLAGLGTSALLFSRTVTEERRRAHTVLVLLQLAAAGYALLVLRHHELIPFAVDLTHRAFGAGLASNVFRILFSWVYLFVPGLFIGGAFPILTGLYVDDHEARTRDMGVVYFWDTLGAILGALVAGFVLLPWLGLARTVLVPAAVNVLVVAALVERRVARVAAVAVGLGGFVLAFWPSKRPVSPAAGSDKGSASAVGRIVAREESPFGLVTVGDDAKGVPGNRALFIGQRDMCHSLINASETLLATNTVAQLRPGARVLNIGLGCGITAGTIAASANVASLEIAEINPVVARMAREYFATQNRHVLELEKTHLFIQDGAELIRQSPRTYDAVVIDVEEPTVMHSSPLYTRDYFQIIRGKLAPGGLLALWVIGTERECGKVILNTLRAVFPNVEVRLPAEAPNFTFYASTRPLELTPLGGSGAQIVSDMEASPITDINTVDNRALERYFNIRRAFALPSTYDEASLSAAERARARASGPAAP